MLPKRKIIIGIHGLGNKPPPSLLQRWWKEAIMEGLRVHGMPRYFLNFELVYWADILHPEPEDPGIKDEEHPLFIDFPYVPAANLLRKEPGKIRKKILDYLEKVTDEVLLNDDLSINFSKITDKIIHRYFTDLEAYYNSGLDAKDEIRGRLLETLHKHRKKDILLIAHSMGTIVAYDVLSQHGPETTVDTFVTTGSPLGVPVVIAKIAGEQASGNNRRRKLRTPEKVTGNWYNHSDLEDKIAANYNLMDDYGPNDRNISPVDSIVSSDYEYKCKKNLHSAYGYVRTPEMAGIIDKFLKQNRPRLFNWADHKINRLMIKNKEFFKYKEPCDEA